MNSDLYAILGVSKSATTAEIKAAYLRLSKALHPDVNPHGATLMQAVNEAYEVLSDAKKRADYDAYGVFQFYERMHQKGKVTPIPEATGTIDLTMLAKAFVPPHIYQAAGPSLERALQDRGISPQAASVEQMLESFGLLKKKRWKRC